ncbi:MAG: ATP-binding protein [Erysipelotrichaceae bacterium]|nr:ATP-binding protein [Erysipelotrichaceae bacterium]
MFIGRQNELNFFNNRYNSSKAELIFLYGRRRVGKTETLHEFCKDKEHIFFSCQECPDNIQLRNFSKLILKENISASQYLDTFNDWEQALKSITELPFEGKKLVVIDEFPYICKNNTAIPSILQNLWDTTLKNENVMIVLCGSAMSFIEKELLGQKNPLYGRATGIYKMKEMDFYDARNFFPNYSIEEQIITYSILGGVPHYLNQFDSELSIEDNIKNNILTKGSILFNEVEFLLHQELRETSLYNSIIEAIALGNTKINEISTHTLIDNVSKTSVYLKNLIELGIIEREVSINAGNKEISNNNRGIYQLTDQFFRFWYSFVFSNYSSLEDGDVEGVYKYAIEPELNRYASITFEKVCQQYLTKLQLQNKLPFRYEKIGKWFGKTTVREHNKLVTKETEIDIFAMSKREKCYLIGECKFKGAPFSYKEYLNTISKLSALNKDNNVYYALFSKNGFDKQILDIEDDIVLLYGIEDLDIKP